MEYLFNSSPPAAALLTHLLMSPSPGALFSIAFPSRSTDRSLGLPSMMIEVVRSYGLTGGSLAGHRTFYFYCGHSVDRKFICNLYPAFIYVF
jgi:hypothetical protein